MKSKEPPKYGRKKQSHNKLRSEIKNTVVSAIIKYNEHNKIYNSCSLQLKQVIVIKIILLIVLNVDLEMLTSFSLFSSSFVFYLILALLFICIIYIFFEFGILSLKLGSPKTLKYWIDVQQGQSYLMGRRCLVGLGWPPFQ